MSARADLLEPLEHLADDPALLAGSHWGRAILRSQGLFQQFQLTLPVKASVRVAGCFTIRRLLPELDVPQMFYILALSKKNVRLLRCTDVRAEAIELPRGVPGTLEEAMALEPPDHDLENRSAAGASTGAMHGVRFGTGSARETQHAHLADFYKIVDRGMHQLLHESASPLVLAGVDEDTAIYRSVSAYRHLAAKSIHGSLAASSADVETLRQGYSILRAETLEREASALAEAKERVTLHRFSSDLDTIVRAAFEGRVSHLYLDENAERVGVFERGEYSSWGSEDLLNLAAVHTLLHRGKAFELPSNLMPDGAAAVAMLRF